MHPRVRACVRARARVYLHAQMRLCTSIMLGSRPSLVLLNWEFPRAPLAALWDTFCLRLCADGAANRLWQSGSRKNVDAAVTAAAAVELVPDIVHGDLDSLDTQSRVRLEDRGVAVVRDPDQNSTDLAKCLALLRGTEAVRQGGHIVVCGAFGGRLDHEMGNLNCAFKWQAEQAAGSSLGSLLLLSQHSLGVVLPPGDHEIVPDRRLEGPICGLVPLGSACSRVSTTGLKWNLDASPLVFGGVVSSSNELDPDASTVTVSTSHPLLWTTSLHWSRYLSNSGVKTSSL